VKVDATRVLTHRRVNSMDRSCALCSRYLQADHRFLVANYRDASDNYL